MFFPLEYYIFSAAFNIITCTSLGVFILLKSRDTAANRYFAYLCLSVSFWNTFYILWLNSDDIVLADYFIRTIMIGAFFNQTLLFHFVVQFLKISQYKKVVFLNYFVSIFILCSVYSPLFGHGGDPFLVFKYWLRPGILFHFALIHLITVILFSQFLLWIHLKKSDGKLRTQLAYLFIGLSISLISGVTNFFSWYRIPIPPFLNVFVSTFIILTSYAIIKHQLLDIHIVIKKSIVYTISIGVISILYLLLVFTLELFLNKLFGYESVFIGILVAFILGILFFPLRNKVQGLINSIFLKGEPFKIAEENIKLREEAAQKERFKAAAALASGIAHEIKNPLTALKTFFEYYEEKKNDPYFIEKFNTVASNELNRIDELTKQLLAFSKASPPKFQATNIKDVIIATLRLLENNIHKNKITVDADIENQILPIDPNQMKQAFLNVILNALEAMPQGGNLTITGKSQNNRYYEISIADTGSGIPKKNLKNIFEPFYSGKDGGAGLGLAVTQRIIQQHKGKIKVASELNKGSRFTLCLPK